jgi:hypothetical protein
MKQHSKIIFVMNERRRHFREQSESKSHTSKRGANKTLPDYNVKSEKALDFTIDLITKR